MKNIEIKVKVLPGGSCLVRNYRFKRTEWEYGSVQDVNVSVLEDGTAITHYRVLLDRKTTGRSRMYIEGGAPIFVTVGDDGIVASS